MKKIPFRFPNVLLVLLALFFSTAVFAQPAWGKQGPPPLPNDEQIEEMLTDLKEELSLSEVQTTQVSELYFAHFEEVKELTQNSNGKRGAQREEMEELKAGLEENVKALLTTEQQEQFDAFQEKNKRQRNRTDGPPRKG